MEKPRCDGTGERGRTKRKGQQDEGGRRGKGEPGSEPAKKSVSAQDTQRKSDLAGGRPGQKLAHRDQIGVASLIDPSPAHHQFIPEITEMRDRAAERCQTELEKSPKHLARRTGGRAV